jgi:peptidoglycan/LPS O-acetylase OafA/YrhL
MTQITEAHPKYMPQLDSLRAFAAVVVAYSHWLPDWCFGLPLGLNSVQLFFVLSGYLITDILVRARVGSSHGESFHILRSFYARRFLRIFPLYYGVILVVCIANIVPLRDTVVWNVTFLTNFHFFFRQACDGPLTHFWSLAVEEQFYLVWPFVLLFTPTRYLRVVIVTIIFVAMSYRVGISMAFPHVKLGWVLLIANLHSLGAGALLAVMGVNSKAAIQLSRWCLIIGVLGTIGLYGYGFVTPGYSSELLLQLQNICMICLFLWLVHAAAIGFRGPLGTFLENPVLISLGTVSYGIYVIHNLAPYLLKYLSDTLGIEEITAGMPRILFLAVITLVCAYASWYLYEKPINSYKRYFPYLPRPITLGENKGHP